MEPFVLRWSSSIRACSTGSPASCRLTSRRAAGAARGAIGVRCSPLVGAV